MCIRDSLDVLAKNPDYKSFLFDGQVVGIEDYLQVRSHREAELRRYISEGRIAVGPWYTLPDLYPLSGESIVRNLLEGRRRAGAPVSYTHLQEYGKRRIHRRELERVPECADRREEGIGQHRSE